MAIATTPGFPEYQSGSASQFIPAIWSGKLRVKHYEATVLTAISNTDYEGEIKKFGDTVHIRTVPDVQIKAYVKGQDLDVQRPNSEGVDLVIDKGQYWNVALDDVTAKQSDIAWMNKWSNDASEQLKIVIDSEVLAYLDGEASATNKGAAAGRISGAFNLGAAGTPVQITKANVLDYIVDCGTVLDENLVPETGRWMVVPAWMAGLIKKSDLKDASLTGDSESVLRNGRLGMIDRFTLYKSNLNEYVLSDTAYHIPFGHKEAFTYASQIVKTEKIRSERSFDDLVRGLAIYGYKAILATSIGDLYAKR